MSKPLTFVRKPDLIKTWIPERPKYTKEFEEFWHNYTKQGNEVCFDKQLAWDTWCAAILSTGSLEPLFY